MDGPGFRQVTEGSGKQGKMEETGCEIICGAPTTFYLPNSAGDASELQQKKSTCIRNQRDSK